MSSRVERLPFTVYDIMGYLVPGIYLTIYLTFFLHGKIAQSLFSVGQPNAQAVIQTVDSVATAARTLKEVPSQTVIDAAQAAIATAAASSTPVTFLMIMTLLFLVEAYVLGHVIAFLSAESLERLCVGFFGYPSETMFLDRDNPSEVKAFTKKAFSEFMGKGVWNRLLILAFLPHAVLLWVLSRTKWYRIAIKPLGKNIEQRIEVNFENLFSIKIDKFGKEERFRIINHHVFCNDPRTAARQYNYVTIYGFCRNMSFAVYIVLLLDTLFLFGSLPEAYYSAEKIYLDIIYNLGTTLALLVAFLKFFRRYSEDALTAFAVMTTGSGRLTPPSATAGRAS